MAITRLVFFYVCGVGTLTVFMFRGQIKSSQWSSQPSVSYTHWALSSTPLFYCIIHPSCLPEVPIIICNTGYHPICCLWNKTDVQQDFTRFQRLWHNIFHYKSKRNRMQSSETESYDTADKAWFKHCLILVSFSLKNNNIDIKRKRAGKR